MKIMRVIPTIQNNRTQNQTAFGAKFTPKSKVVLDNLANSLGAKEYATFLKAIDASTGEIAQVVSKAGEHPIIHLHHLNSSGAQPAGYRAYISHLKTNLPSFTFDGTYTGEGLLTYFLKNVKTQSKLVAEELNEVSAR